MWGVDECAQRDFFVAISPVAPISSVVPVFFCFKICAGAHEDVQYVSNGRNKHPPPKFPRASRRYCPKDDGGLSVDRYPPNAVFNVGIFSVLFSVARFFGYPPKCRCPRKIKKPIAIRVFASWPFFGVGFPGHPVYMLAPSPPRTTSKYLRRNLNETAKKGQKKRGNKCKFEFRPVTHFAAKQIPKPWHFSSRNRLWVFF